MRALNKEIGCCTDKINSDIQFFKKDFCLQFDGKRAHDYGNTIVEFLTVCITSDGFYKIIVLRSLINSKSETILAFCMLLFN
ncbi:hypothetical protein A3Q56_03109 [Intoshia linei]|uniref:Uncharacterized protein n=1 Tax=Intoshia linei TaxID=1819745 RepID=A0A177B6P3_9BILA|nr:hypothetical protein A3Q56_03109 [Intoshia linei]